MVKLAVFLGNPGPQYERTRHNLGRIVARALPGWESLDWKGKFQGRLAAWGIPPAKAWLLEPETFMNLSGRSAGAAAGFLKALPGEVLVVHDDLELPFGTAAWRAGGGLGGHNGLRSVKEGLGTPDFLRFRLGIGRPDRGSVESWVLGRFSADEEAVLPLLADGAARYLERILDGDLPVEGRPDPVVVVPG